MVKVNVSEETLHSGETLKNPQQDLFSVSLDSGFAPNFLSEVKADFFVGNLVP